ncbi:hypothetical protein FHP05_02725 [Cerasibacillus terrae]|uniref:Uncharacterized protein n=1 Tax=Cerasibacillus terrae TaxID=2498845 RepID=A0A5C8P491_9BACI|nr:SA1362 family protein [Cerasibacillus terrae]TXL67953.1 hypothetical protein FHP05_02725 [Cerasibacillus terrae]
MKKGKASLFIYVIIGLAIIGVTSQVFTNLTGFLVRTLTGLAISALIIAGIYFFFFRNRNNSNEMKKYQQAVKQSKRKYSNTNKPKHNQTKKESPIRKNANKKYSHLRVIDGNKSKRKKRASN